MSSSGMDREHHSSYKKQSGNQLWKLCKEQINACIILKLEK